MSQPPASRLSTIRQPTDVAPASGWRAPGRKSRDICPTRSWVLALVCCVLAGVLYAQEAAPAAGQPEPAGPATLTRSQTTSFWTPEQEQTYNEVKAVLDRGEVPTSRQRRGLEDVCDQLAAKLRDAAQAGNWAGIRAVLVGLDTHAVSPVMKHVLTAEAPEQARLQGIIILVSIKDTVQPKEGIVKALKDPSPAVRMWALRGVVQKQYTEAGEAVAALLLDENPEVCLAATRAAQTLKVPKVEAYLVAMVARELERRAPLTQQLADLQAQRTALQSKVGRTPEEEQQVTLLSQRTDEASGRISFSNLIIYRVGEALSALTNNADGSELKSAMSDEELKKVIEALKQKYPLAAR
jgi:hypothetical protein